MTCHQGHVMCLPGNGKDKVSTEVTFVYKFDQCRRTSQLFSSLSCKHKQKQTKMKTFTLAAIAVTMCLGVALADYGSYGGYGSYGSYGGGYSSGYTYMPVSGYGASAGADNSFLYLIGLLFLILILFNGNLFNTTSTSSTTPITILQG